MTIIHSLHRSYTRFIRHNIESPTLNVDYFEHYTSPDIRAAHRPLWVHYMDGQVSLIPAESDTARKDYSPYPTCVQIDSYDDMRPTEDSDEYW